MGDDDFRDIGLTGQPPRAQEVSGKKYLLAIGIDKYNEASIFKPLTYPVNDAKKLAAILEDEYGFQKHVPCFDPDSTGSNIKKQIVELKKVLQPEDHLVVFFAGHGAAVGDDGYWIPFDSDNTPELNLPVGEIIKLMMQSPAQKLLIVDCCFSGTANLEAIYSSIRKSDPRLMVITSGNMEKVPDKSVFMEALLYILKTKNITSIEGLIGDIRILISGKPTATTVTGFASADKQGAPFVLTRHDVVSYQLTNSFFELNYHAQLTKEHTGTRLFNLIYVKGSPEAGHHIFTHRYLKSADNTVTMFNYVLRSLSFGKESQSGDYNIWKQFANIFGFTSADENKVMEQVLTEIAAKNWLLMLKLGSNYDEEAMEQALLNFWKGVNAYLREKKIQIKDYPNRFYLFVWDRRVDEPDLAFSKDWETMDRSPLARFQHLPPLDEITIDPEFEDWHYETQFNWDALRLEEKFAQLNATDIRPPLSIENVICQVAGLCNRINVYDNLFQNKSNLWIQ